MNSSGAIWCIFFVTGAFGVQTDTYFVREGDSVTLFSGTEATQDLTLKFYFNGNRVAQLSEDQSKTCTDVQCNESNERFRGRLKLDNQTWSLTITNTSTSHSGLYQLVISSSSSSSGFDKTFHFNISVNGVHEVETMSVMEGKTFTLQPSEARQSSDVMEWIFNDTLIAEIPRDPSRSCADKQCKVGLGRFKDRLKLDHQNRSLTITNSKTTDSGQYQLKITSSRIDSVHHQRCISVTTEKRFSVKVTGPPGSGLSPGAVVAIIFGVFGALVLAAVGKVIYRRRQARQNGPIDDDAKHNP